MTEGAADLLAAAARDETLARECARFCSEAGGDADALNRALQVVPIEGREWPFEAPRSTDFDLNSEAGRAAYRAGIASARLRYLEGRADVLRERAAFRERLAAPVLPDLEAVSDAITDDPASVAEIASENAERRVAEIQRTREAERQRLRERGTR